MRKFICVYTHSRIVNDPWTEDYRWMVCHAHVNVACECCMYVAMCVTGEQKELYMMSLKLLMGKCVSKFHKLQSLFVFITLIHMRKHCYALHHLCFTQVYT